MLILRILGYMLTHIRENPPNPTKTHIYSNQFEVYKCQDCLEWPTVQKISTKKAWKDYNIPQELVKHLGASFWWLLTGFSRPFHGFFNGRFTDCSRSRFCRKFQVDTFTRSYSFLYLVTSWSQMQTFAQSPCSQAHFTCIERTKWPFYPHIYWPLSPNITF